MNLVIKGVTMKVETVSLVKNIQNCSSCKFRDKSIQPLPPSVPSTIKESIMFIGENPSWEEKQDVPFSPSTISGKALEKYYKIVVKLTQSPKLNLNYNHKYYYSSYS